MVLIFYPHIYPYIASSLVMLVFIKLFLDWFINLISAILQSKNLFNNVSLLQILRSLTLVLPLILLYYFDYGLNEFLVYVILLASVVAVLITLKEVVGKNINLKNVKNGFSFNKSVIPSSKYFFISSLMVYIYMQSDLLMISIMVDPVEVARYAVVLTLISGAYLIPSSLYTYYLPKMTQSFQNTLEFKKIIFQFRTLIVFTMFPLSLILFLFPKNILNIIYGTNYMDSGYILQILSIVLFFHSICFVNAGMLTASGNQKIRSNIQFLAAILNCILNLYAIPKYGAEGAAITTLITEILIVYLYFQKSKM
ncbi:O-antigen/teichoic acid export membrane protein [Methanococcus maripaludis]|uniref:O-antigen/teichoic acid export membrane protein n=1 Tax=Methanococcus maripaludis TaxID=39152 RepID=A0A7J9NIX8_METMI|nr:O-antigen/teichoic acid export membrane protein [Methanococcus maripaludis]